MTKFAETPIVYRLSNSAEPSTITVEVGGGEDILDLIAHDGVGTAAMRLDVDEALELIATLTRAIAVAINAKEA